MLQFLKSARVLYVLPAMLLLVGNCLYAQEMSVEKMKRVLVSAADLSNAELAVLEKGKFVIKELPAENPGEIAAFGGVRLSGTHEAVLGAFRRAIEKQKKETSLEYGRIGNPPKVSDLRKLTISGGEIEDLRGCKIGDCNWNLSEKMIGRVQTQIDWSADDHKKEASALLRNMLIAYAARYLRGGDKALIEYHDDPDLIRLQDEYVSAGKDLAWVADLAPGLSKYLKGLGAGDLTPVENVMDFTKVRVALKPVLIFTHSVTYTKIIGGVPTSLIVSKQIYANHYFNSSMNVTLLLSFPDADGATATYLIFVNRSRASALTGTIGKMIRGIVAGEATGKLETALRDTKRYTAQTMGNKEELADIERSGIFSRLFQGSLVIWVLVFVATGVLIWFFTRDRRGL